MKMMTIMMATELMIVMSALVGHIVYLVNLDTLIVKMLGL